MRHISTIDVTPQSDNQQMIGRLFPCEWREEVDPKTGRAVTQLTTGQGHSYPLYYFIPSITRDGKYLVFHSERSGWVQLYRMDLTTGEIGKLTDGHTPDSGWALWCEWRLRGIYDHLSALNLMTNEVYYFQDDEIRSTHIETFTNRVVTKLPPGRMPIGQNAFSPDGSLFAYIHTHQDTYIERLKDREVRTNMGLFDRSRDHQDFRNMIQTTLATIDTRTGQQQTVIETDFHFHHVLFLDNQTMVLNHPRDTNGMWTVDTDGSNVCHLRPADALGAHNAGVVHQVITDRGIIYEAVSRNGQQRTTYLGRYDPASGHFEETALPVHGSVHTGYDPAGRFSFIEHAGEQHELLTVHLPPEPHGAAEVRLLRTLRTPVIGQRNHAHPFLSRNRKQLFFTDRAGNGFNQIHSMNIEDLVEPPGPPSKTVPGV